MTSLKVACVTCPVHYCQLRAKRALSLYTVYGSSALLVLNGTSLNSFNALLVLIRWYSFNIIFVEYFNHTINEIVTPFLPHIFHYPIIYIFKQKNSSRKIGLVDLLTIFPWSSESWTVFHQKAYAYYTAASQLFWMTCSNVIIPQMNCITALCLYYQCCRV